MVQSTRLYIGGLGPKVKDKHLEKEFSPFGSILTVDIKEKKDPDGEVLTRFAYVTLSSDQNQINNCIRKLNGSNLKGSNIRIEQAKESFIDRLKREREQNQQQNQDYNPTRNNSGSKTTNSSEDYKEKLKQFTESYNKRGSENDTRKPKKRRRRSDSDEDDSFKKGMPMFKGTSSLHETTPEITDFDRNIVSNNNNETEENMLSSFKKFSNVWADSDSEEEANKGPSEETNSTRQEWTNESNEEKHNSMRIQRESVAMVRYDPALPLHSKYEMKSRPQPVSVESEAPASKYAKVSNDLNFAEKSSGFSLLQQFSGENIQEDYVEPKGELKFVQDDVIESVEPKSRHFFIKADDDLIKDAVAWMCQNVEEKDKEMYKEIRSEIMDIVRTRKARSRRSKFGKKEVRRDWNNVKKNNKT